MSKKKKKQKYSVKSELKGLIRAKSSSYRKLAKVIGIAPNTLSDKINGYYAFGADEIDSIADELDIFERDIVKYFFPHRCSNYTKTVY